MRWLRTFREKWYCVVSIVYWGAKFPSIPFFLNTFQNSLRSSLQSRHFVAVDGFADSQVSEMICEILLCDLFYTPDVLYKYIHFRCVLSKYIFFGCFCKYLYFTCDLCKCIFSLDVFHTNAYLRMCFMQIRIFQMCYVQIYLSKENARMVKTEEQDVLKSN